jgi:erythromycin esterase-like protein
MRSTMLPGLEEGAEILRRTAHPLGPSAASLDPLLDRIGGARMVLLGESSHGTHEFYRIRAEITKRLIRERRFSAVAIEGDWPDAQRVHRFIRGDHGIHGAADALSGFRRFPQWMWRNADVLDLVGWLREHNDDPTSIDQRVGFYGLDLYSLHASIAAVIDYLARVDPAAAERARTHYACFDPFGLDPQHYGHAVAGGRWDSCRDEVIAELIAIRQAAADYAGRTDHASQDEQFVAEQNAAVVVGAERYYREMFLQGNSSWNLRDRHMADTLEAILQFQRRHVGEPGIVVWAHNSHVGDARATERTRSGELNIGQLVRERYVDDAVLVGFSTSLGTVTAARNWDEPAERRVVRPPIPDSWESLFSEVDLPAFLTVVGEDPDADMVLDRVRLQRAIGVIYRPETERASHYYHTHLGRQFDAMLHVERSRAVEPLEQSAGWLAGEVPETYPSGL